MKRKFFDQFSIRPIVYTALLSLSSTVIASDFNLPFINASELGNTYAGWAAEAVDASTTYSNPAGLVRIKSPQLVIAALGVTGTTKFHGTTVNPFGTQSGTASGTLGGFLPLFYYAHPINNNVVFGVGLNGPFGLGTNYPKDSIVRYFATRGQVVVIDLNPSLGVAINNKLSLGLGLDIEHMSLTLNSMVGLPFSLPDAESQNRLRGWGYGFHAGLLYQFTPCTRAGISYNSQVMFHTNGSSEIYSIPLGNVRIHQKMNTPLPAYAQASIYHDVTPRLAAMASVFYTRWSVIEQLTLRNVVFPGGSNAPITVPFEYHDTVDYAVGLTYTVNEKWKLRTGVEFFNTPSNNRDRIIADPLGKMTLVGIGAHYQYNKHYGYDFGYAHDFFHQAAINTTTPLTVASGHSNTQSNIFGLQLTWDMC